MSKHPKSWRVKSLEDVAVVQTGASKGGKTNGELVSLPYLRVANVQDGWIDTSEVKYLEVPASKVDRFSLQEGDLLLTEGGDFDKLGRGALWDGRISPCLHQNHVFAVRVQHPDVLPQFLASQTSSHHGRSYFLSCAKQSTNLASINSTQLKQFPVLVPPITEQRMIAEILGTWDRAIATLEKLIAAQTRLKRGLMQQLLTGQRRFPVFKRSKWKSVRLGDVAANVNERNNDHSLATDRLYAVTKSEGMVPMREHVKGATLDRCKIVHEHWFAYNPMRLNIGSIAQWNNPDPVMVSPDYVVFQADGSKLLPAYLNHLRFTRQWNHYVNVAGNGSVRVRIYFSELAGFHFKCPPLEEQRRITEVLNTADTEIGRLQQQLETLRTQKRGLMQKLLTGEIRVKTKEKK